MNILITGGAGYIGSHTALKLIQRGDHITILDNLENGKQQTLDTLKQIAGDFAFIKADLRDINSLRACIADKAFDAVIHFAAYLDVKQSTKQPQIYFDNNIGGTNNLLTVLNEKHITKLIFSSTAAVYGTPDTSPISEAAVKRPESPYGMSKFLVEKILETYCQYLQFNVVALRYFNPAGSYQGKIGEMHTPETHLIPRALHSLIDPLFKFAVYGNDYPTTDGSAVRDFIHIIDLAQAHIAALDYLAKNTGFEVFNIGTGKGESVLQVIQAIEQVTGKKLNYDKFPRRQGDPASLVADPQKFQDLVGWQAKHSLSEIIESAWKWEQNRSNNDYA